MSSPPKVVLCVKEGTWGNTPQESASSFVKICIVEPLKRAQRVVRGTNEKMAAADVEVVDTLAEASERLARGGVDILVLNSRNLINTARDLKRQYPCVQVFVFTALIPADEVVIVHKNWVVGDRLVEMILNTPQGL